MLGKGWSTALEMSSKRSNGGLKIGFVGTAVEFVFENLPNALAFFSLAGEVSR